jgi:hypothetical protein
VKKKKDKNKLNVKREIKEKEQKDHVQWEIGKTKKQEKKRLSSHMNAISRH